MVPPCSDRISRVPPYSRINWSLRIRGYHPLWPDFPDRSAYLPKTTGLFRVRSPLLAESLLMSVPPGTEMFQFPGFASSTYVFSERYPLPGGLPHSDIHGSKPARGSPWLFAACHVLHRLLVPRHPPNALISLDVIGHLRVLTMHGNHPQSDRPCGLSRCGCRDGIISLSYTSHSTGPRSLHPNPVLADHSASTVIEQNQQDRSAPLNTHHRLLGRLPLARQLSRSDMQPAAGQ